MPEPVRSGVKLTRRTRAVRTRTVLTCAVLTGARPAWVALIGAAGAHTALVRTVLVLAACGTGLSGFGPPTSTVYAQSGSGSSATRSVSTLPDPALFDVSWSDLSDFHADLGPSFTSEAAAHHGAPIYHLEYVVESPTDVQGRLELRVVNDSDTAWPALWFHLFPYLLGGSLDVTDVTVGGIAVPAEVDREAGLMSVELPQPLPAGGELVVIMDFSVAVPTGEQRNYSLLSYRDEILSLAHPYPILAVFRDGHGWDLDPRATYGDLLFAEASWFRVRMDAPAALVLAASGSEAIVTEAIVTEAEASAEGRRVWTVRAGPVRDLYLSLGPYESATATTPGTAVRSYFTEGQGAAAIAAAEYAAAALEIFSSRWTPYPYRTLDLVPLTTQALGVEFPGIIALADRLYDDDSPNLEAVVVHEVAHQWFYGLVGNDQATEPWLDEALAQYAVYVYAQERYGDEAAASVLRSYEQRWRRADEDVPIGFPVTGYTPAEYGSVVYGRGPLVIAQMAERIGDKAFDTFLRGYVAAHRWRVATPEDFRLAAEAACACSFEDLFTAAIRGR